MQLSLQGQLHQDNLCDRQSSDAFLSYFFFQELPHMGEERLPVPPAAPNLGGSEEFKRMQSYMICLWSHRKPVAENKPNPASQPSCSPLSTMLCQQLGYLNLSTAACVSPQQFPSHPRLQNTTEQPLLQALVLPSLLKQKTRYKGQAVNLYD